MAVEVTLMLPEALVEQAKRFGQATQRDVGQVLADALEMMWSTRTTGFMSDIPEAIRQWVRERAGNRCEYCLSHQDYVMGRLQILIIYSQSLKEVQMPKIIYA